MMRFHPSLKKRNIASSSTPKKLRKLPHVFAKVLQLPFHSNADVSIQETSDSFRFTVATTRGSTDACFRAHTVEIYPGVVKIYVVRVRGTDGGDVPTDDQLNLWRYRLPASTKPELTSARCNGQELVVTVPKEVNSEDIDMKDQADGDVRGNENGRVIMVQ